MVQAHIAQYPFLQAAGTQPYAMFILPKNSLRLLAQRFERNIVKFTVLFTGKAAGVLCSNMMFFWSSVHRILGMV
ncbi:hypothetical protein C6A46_15275 [Escherichia coli]|nr:hypothetical protein C6A46_15275 [Escherichia coli]